MITSIFRPFCAKAGYDTEVTLPTCENVLDRQHFRVIVNAELLPDIQRPAPPNLFCGLVAGGVFRAIGSV